MTSYEKCIQGKSDCQFYARGYCLSLADTAFARHCPFYKSCKVDYNIDYTFDKFGAETFRRVRGLGGNYLISRSGKVINHHKTEVNHLTDFQGNAVVRLKYLGHCIQLRVDELIAETYGRRK